MQSAKTKRKSLIVLQTADGPEYISMLSITEGLHRDWCNRHGYDYQCFIGIKRGCHPWHAAFNRFYMLNDAIRQGKHDWALYMDTDCVVVNRKDNMQDLLDDKYAIVACRGVCDQPTMIWEINDGVFFLNLKHPATKEIIRLCIQMYESYTLKQLAAEKPGCFAIENENETHLRANDQRILQGILYAKYVPFVKAYRDAEYDKFNQLSSKRIKQLLRQYFRDSYNRMGLLSSIVALVSQDKAINLDDLIIQVPNPK